MAAPGAPPRSSTFLYQYGTPTLFWRVLEAVGYTEKPQYVWRFEPISEERLWYWVRAVIPARTEEPLWQEWSAEAEGRSPWEAAEVVALSILRQIHRAHEDTLDGGPAATFPTSDPLSGGWSSDETRSLVRNRAERAQSTGSAMSAMIAVLLMSWDRERTITSRAGQLRETEGTCS